MEKVNNFDNMWDKSNNTTAFKSTTISPQHLKVLRFNHSLKVLQYNNNNIQKYCNTTTTFKSTAIQQQHSKVLQSNNNNIQKYCNTNAAAFKIRFQQQVLQQQKGTLKSRPSLKLWSWFDSLTRRRRRRHWQKTFLHVKTKKEKRNTTAKNVEKSFRNNLLQPIWSGRRTGRGTND